MLFGTSKNKNGEAISEYEAFKPWGSQTAYGGDMVVESEGHEYKIHREFHKGKFSIYDEADNDITKSFEIDKSRGAMVGDKLLGIDEFTFQNVAVVGQGKVRLDLLSQKDIIQKMINLSQTGDEDFSYTDVRRKLDRILQDEIGTDRTTTKPKNILKKEVKALKSAILDFDKKRKNLQSSIINNDKLAERKTDIVKKISDSKKVIEVKEQTEKEYKYEKARYDAKLDVQREEQRNFEKSIRLKKIIDNSLIIIANIVLLVFTLIYNPILSIIPVVLSSLALVLNNKLSYRISAPKVEIEDFDLIIAQLKKQEREKIIKEVGGESAEKYTEVDVDKLKQEIGILENQLDGINYDIQRNTIEIKNMEHDLLKEKETKDLLADKSMKLGELEEKEKMVLLAIEKLDEAYSKYKMQVMPKFTESLRTIVSKITSGKYTDVRYTDKNEILIQEEYGNLVPAEALSYGTIDQMYMCFRLAALDKYSSVPIMLDETFAYFDEDRLSEIIKYISEIAKDNQVIIFSCSDREEKLLKDNNVTYKKVEMV
jgi:DNA repair exonuclease SbcCD ATPase subunit